MISGRPQKITSCDKKSEVGHRESESQELQELQNTRARSLSENPRTSIPPGENLRQASQIL